MAGVDFQKYKTSQKVKSVMRHCDKDKRAEATHQNEHIDLTKTKYNRQLDRNYEQTVERFDKRMEWLEAQPNKNKRSDKVLCFALEIPLPEDLPKEKDIEWLNKTKNIIADMYGRDNIMNVYYHVDEQHKYMDSEKGAERLSRKHIHVLVVPEIDGRLNGRDFSARRNMNKLNNAIHEMSLHDYGVKFMDGSKKKSKDTVEALKRKSERLELEGAIKDLEARKKGLEGEIQALEQHKQDLLREPIEDYCKGFKGRKKPCKEIGETVSAKAEKLQKVAKREEEQHLEERNNSVYEAFNIKPEGIDELEEFSDDKGLT